MASQDVNKHERKKKGGNLKKPHVERESKLTTSSKTTWAERLKRAAVESASVAYYSDFFVSLVAHHCLAIGVPIHSTTSGDHGRAWSRGFDRCRHGDSQWKSYNGPAICYCIYQTQHI